MGIVLIVCHKNPPGKWYPISFANTFAGILQIAGILQTESEIVIVTMGGGVIYWLRIFAIYNVLEISYIYDVMPWYYMWCLLWYLAMISYVISPEVDERYSEGAPVPLYSPTVWWYRYIYDDNGNVMTCQCDVMPWYLSTGIMDFMPW